MRAPEPWPPVITLPLSRLLQMPCPPGHNLLAIHIVVPSLISHSSPFGPSPESPSGPKPTRPRAPDMIILLYIIHPRLPGHQIPALCTITFSSSRQWPKSRPPGNQITGPQLRIITFPALRASGRSDTHPIQRSKPSPFPIFQASTCSALRATYALHPVTANGHHGCHSTVTVVDRVNKGCNMRPGWRWFMGQNDTRIEHDIFSSLRTKGYLKYLVMV